MFKLKNNNKIKIFSCLFFFWLGLVLPGLFVFAQDTQNQDQRLNGTVNLFLSPRTGSFLVDGVVDVGVYIDTLGANINTVDLVINFDPKKMIIVKPSGGQSIFGLWVDVPSYDNTKGTVHMSGSIPEGLVTNSGLITTLSFKILAPGSSSVLISNQSAVYKNDGLGTKLKTQTGFANFNFSIKPKDGVFIQSETHPFEQNWSNNNSPVISWVKDPDSNGFSVVFDNNPYTIPPNEITTTNPFISYQNLNDGVWYAHVKSQNEAGWGNTSHYQIKIDTLPPNNFEPTVSILKNDKNSKEYLVLFSSSDNASGIDHYEVGILEDDRAKTSLPVFVQAESPYVLPINNKQNVRVIVKAFDKAGNVSEGYVALYPNKNNYIIFGAIGLVLLIIILHYLFGHRVLYNFKRAYRLVKGSKNVAPEITVTETPVLQTPVKKLETLDQAPKIIEPGPKKINLVQEFGAPVGIANQTQVNEPKLEKIYFPNTANQSQVEPVQNVVKPQVQFIDNQDWSQASLIETNNQSQSKSPGLKNLDELYEKTHMKNLDLENNLKNSNLTQNL